MRLQRRRTTVGLAFAMVLGTALLMGAPASAATPTAAARSAAARAEMVATVTLWNDGSFLARVTVDWTNVTSLQRFEKDSGNIATGGNAVLPIPEEARQIVVRAWAVDGKDIFKLTYPTPTRMCVRVDGTASVPTYGEYACAYK